MNERTIFLEALERPTLADKAAFLETACRDNPVLRSRVEALLQSHYNPGGFLEKSAVERVAEKLATFGEEGETEGVPAPSPIDERLDFLTPSESPGSLGRIGHYEVQEVVGRGGMGIVLRAFDERLHRVVAIKVMAPQLATSAAARKRFSKEAQAAAAICHDHIVTIHAVDEANGLPYLAMQYVGGLSLQERINRSGSMQLQEILRIGMQTASGLAAAHAQGLIHRDVKPANILLENGVERVKITDFGLARAAADSSTSQSGMIAGTPQYMSPEQARGGAIDRRADLFSLGSVLYAMCTGRSPFRGANSIAVLKRVCEDTPAPIRETNPEVPIWLVAIIERLQAKDPDQRYQTAAEVAQVLGQRLAEVQHPSVAVMPAIGKSGPGPASNSKRWAVAAAVLLCLLAGLGMAEGTGVTNLASTVIRIVTGEGTLVVETDPDVQVALEGNGDLTFQLAGGQSIRVPTGDYRVKATKEGKPIPLDKELVSIARGKNQFVRVCLEREPQIVSAPKVEQGAFVLLAAGKERKFDTLTEAVLTAAAGDTIEIRGNGPFVSDGLTIAQQMVIRAGEGYTPTITLSQAAADKNTTLLKTSAALVLEGLELSQIGGAKGPFEGRWPTLLGAWGKGALRFSNCRFVHARNQGGRLISSNRSVCILRNCQFSTSGNADVDWHCPPGGRFTVENCISASGTLTAVSLRGQHPTDVIVQVRGNTTVGGCLQLGFDQAETPVGAPPIHLNFSGNLTHSTAYQNSILRVDQAFLEPPLSARDAEDLLRALVTLHEQRNVHMVGTQILHHVIWSKTGLTHLSASQGKDLAGWKRFWQQSDTGSIEGEVRFQGGDLLQRALTDPDQLTPDDFRLRPDSAGYRAGADGKDLGADMDLVGPGAAYERWKKTPEYQEWLKEIGQEKE